MEQKERLDYLVKRFLDDSGRYKGMEVADDPAEKFLEGGALFYVDRVSAAGAGAAPADVALLKEYMDSGQWRLDYEADEAGEIPPALKRGVLSQDGLYNLLENLREA